MPLPQALIDRLTEDKLYVPTTIDLGTYSELKRGVPTIGIPTVLLTNLPDDDGAAAAVKALIGEIESGKGLIEDHIDGVELDQLEPARADSRDRDARGREEASRGPATRRLIWVGLFALGLVVAHARRNPGSLRRGLAAGSYMLVLSGSLTGVWLLLSLAMMQAEGHLNPKFRDRRRVVPATRSQIVARMSDDRLMTAEGEIWRWLGLLLFPIILGWLFSDVVKEAFRLSAVKLARVIRCAQLRQAPVGVHRDRAVPPANRRGIVRADRRRRRDPLVFLNWNCRAEQIAACSRNDAGCRSAASSSLRPTDLGRRMATRPAISGSWKVLSAHGSFSSRRAGASGRHSARPLYMVESERRPACAFRLRPRCVRCQVRGCRRRLRRSPDCGAPVYPDAPAPGPDRANGGSAPILLRLRTRHGTTVMSSVSSSGHLDLRHGASNRSAVNQKS